MANVVYFFPSRFALKTPYQAIRWSGSDGFTPLGPDYDKQPSAVLVAYSTCGKVLNQCLRENQIGLTVPECFAPPMLQRFLSYGPDG